MRMKICWGVFGVLVGLFVVAVTPLGGLIHLHGDFRDFVVPLGLLGVVLLIMAAVTRIRMPLKSFLLGTGASAVGWPVSLYLHSILIRFFPMEPFTYVLFFFVFTPAFVISATGAIVIGVKQQVSSY